MLPVKNRLYPCQDRKPIEPDESLADKVDLLRVRDARKALRRKYACKNTVDTVFSKYDVGTKGFIDPRDLQNQAKECGFTITVDEAQVLIQSAKP